MGLLTDGDVRLPRKEVPVSILRASITLALSLAFAGCAAADQDPDSADREAEARVRPKHPKTGRLLVRSPRGLATNVTLDEIVFGYEGLGLELDRETVVPAGAGTLFAHRPGLGQFERPLVVVGGQRTEYRLGALFFDRPKPAGGRIVGIDVGDDTIFEGPAPHDALSKVGPGHTRVSYEPFEKGHLRLDGTHRFAWGAFDGVEVELAQDAVVTVDTGDLRTRAATRIELATAELPNCSDTFYLQATDLASGASVKSTLEREDGNAFVVAHAPWNVGRRVRYELRPGSSMPDQAISFELPTSAGRIDVVRLGRLDVDDVEFGEGDAARTISGWYTVRSTTGARTVIAGCPTGTGIDLRPGEYDVEIDYEVGGQPAQIVERVQISAP
jgi:hypothetical protein